jgi:hypothetical protein
LAWAPGKALSIAIDEAQRLPCQPARNPRQPLKISNKKLKKLDKIRFFQVKFLSLNS